MKKIFLLAATALVIFSSCKKHDEVKGGVFKGPESSFQHGKAWTWVELDNSGNPLKLAIAIDDAAMNSLDTSHPGGTGHHHVNTVSLPLNAKAGMTPFQHVMLDWNPHGHEPEFIYGHPHFDFHFYTTTSAEREAIPVYEADSMKFKNVPAADYLPANYFNPGGGVPQMGAHWLDVTSPELNGQTFTQTFIYGTYNGKVNFIEPMITEAFIKANPNFERNIPQPAKYQNTGYFPTKMRIEKTNGVTNVILTGFIYRTKS